ncbi:prolyl oligopeptidase family serine peptidase [uncultured Roseibium sp.]|uniref:alpha/beta hydrolase family protein n=1 Tax=uncultured Roseibium sp. TaxID=1936171 RepID=UPI0026061799|nr:prolyl oligopeptidase family serine peptidase [uncultured Roseibium sp.]
MLQPKPDPRKTVKSLLSSAFAAVALLVTTPALSQSETASQLPFGPGVTKLVVQDNRVDRKLEGDLWYPTGTPGIFQRADKSKVWQMADADPEGEPAEGTFPLLVISHGMYGNTFNQAWLASEMARRGYIVALVNHPGTSTFKRDADQARELWERPVDLSRLISYLVGTSPYKTHIDPERIYAAGHSLGGFTTMLLAGAQFDTDRYRSVCTDDATPVACSVLKGWSVAETQRDQEEMETRREDERISKFISLDLGGTPVFSRSSLAAIDKPVLVLGSGRADMLDQTIESRALSSALPENSHRHVELEDAGHFDFMGVCKSAGFAILKEHEPGDEMVCINGGAEREEQHRRIVREIVHFLEQ